MARKAKAAVKPIAKRYFDLVQRSIGALRNAARVYFEPARTADHLDA